MSSLMAVSRTIGVIVALLTMTQVARAGTTCPAESGGRRLSGFSLFHGDPANQADLAPAGLPAKTGYINVWNLKSSAGLTAVCRYDGGRSTKMNLPDGVRQCRLDNTPGRTIAACE